MNKKNETLTIAGHKIKKIYDSDMNKFLKKTIIMYGDSGSGKTVLLKDILYNLKNFIPNTIVVCPTNKNNNSFTDIIPEILIFDDVDEKQLETILQRQEVLVNNYNTYTKRKDKQIELLEKFLSYDDINLKKINNLKKIYKENYNKIENDNSLDIQKKSFLLEKIKMIYEKNISTILNEVFNNKKNDILQSYNNNRITEDEFNYYKFYNLNPNFLIILDDCTSTSKIWSKFIAIKRLFSEGRHYHITFIITCQYDTSIDAYYRNNAHISIFTTKRAAIGFFERQQGYNKNDKKKLNVLVDNLFSKSIPNNFRKLVYFKDSEEEFNYIIAVLRNKFKFGSKYLWNLQDSLKKINNDELEDNYFQTLF